MNIVLFEDRQVELLYPITTGRPAYTILCGGHRLIDWIRQLEGKWTGWVRPHLTRLQQLDCPDSQPLDQHQPWTLLVNARLVPTRSQFELLSQLARRGMSTLVLGRSREEAGEERAAVAAAVLPTNQLPSNRDELEHFDFQQLGIESTGGPSDNSSPQLAMELFDFPHDLIRWHLACFAENLEYRLSQGEYRQLQDGFFVASEVEIAEGLAVDTRQGPVVVDARASVGPHCFLAGPVYLGPHARVIEHSSLKDHVCIGHTSKVGGEVEASIIDAYSNKQHHGFLGHSYLGSWINLGAGTCNSDLKNTYGEVKMEYGGRRVSTGMQFIGCLIGDYSKTAINTGIFTGKTIGVCSMLYGFVTTNVPSFVNYARSFGQVTEMPPAVMVATQQRMFSRRQVEQRPDDLQLIHDMYHLTRHERQLVEEPLVL